METRYLYLLIGVLMFLSIGMSLALLRSIKGPRLADRIVAINIIGSLTSAAIAVLSVILQQTWLLDVCLIYCMISFLAVVVLAKISIASHKEGEDKDNVI